NRAGSRDRHSGSGSRPARPGNSGRSWPLHRLPADQGSAASGFRQRSARHRGRSGRRRRARRRYSTGLRSRAAVFRGKATKSGPGYGLEEGVDQPAREEPVCRKSPIAHQGPVERRPHSAGQIGAFRRLGVEQQVIGDVRPIGDGGEVRLVPDRQGLDDPRPRQPPRLGRAGRRLVAVQLDQVRPQDQSDFAQQGVVGVDQDGDHLGAPSRPVEQGGGVQRRDVARALRKHHRPDKGRPAVERRIQRIRRRQAADLGQGHAQIRCATAGERSSAALPLPYPSSSSGKPRSGADRGTQRRRRRSLLQARRVGFRPQGAAGSPGLRYARRRMTKEWFRRRSTRSRSRSAAAIPPTPDRPAKPARPAARGGGPRRGCPPPRTSDAPGGSAPPSPSGAPRSATPPPARRAPGACPRPPAPVRPRRTAPPL
uniref:Serine/threonine protein kinase n=1 Tax=Parastrongyloides trichosuri TaxID=131310 RepID=A0A0N4ZXS9_PARTI